MLDSFEILTTSGVVLWSRLNAPVSTSIVNALISDVFIEEKALNSASKSTGSHGAFKKEKLTVKWTVVKDLGLIFVAVYQSLLHLSWIDDLLDVVRDIFVKRYGQATNIDRVPSSELSSFDRTFDAVLNRLDQTSERTSTADDLSQDASESDVGVRTPEESDEDPTPSVAKPDFCQHVAKSHKKHPIPNHSTPVVAAEGSRPASPAVNNHLLVAKTNSGPGRSKKGRKANTGASSGEETSPARRPADSRNVSSKAKRRWDAAGVATEDNDEVLDYSSPGSGAQERDTSLVDNVTSTDMGSRRAKGEFILKDLDDEVDAILAGSKATRQTRTGDATDDETSRFGGIGSYFRNIVSGKTLSKQDLAKPLKGLEDHLVEKNVAREAAVRLCESVERDLIGYKTAGFSNPDTIIRESMAKALSRILTPTTSLDLLRSINSTITAPTGARPYVISIVGVNGVGKSTNLSKIAYFLLQNNFRILVCAADTFRSGAVEQLGVHVRNLTELAQRERVGKVELFEKGYGKDAAVIAREAVVHASGTKTATATSPIKRQDLLHDIVLIDTAGRRHNDTRLMSSLTKFGQLANPDKIFMVGEALVGTDSVAQARNFSAQFVDTKGRGRGLDGFIISKCDTVGDMVGTLVSMVHATGIPVVFLGVGQHYGDLRGLNVKWAVDKLMK